MSKLFEETLNPNIPTSADIYIYFKADGRVLRCHSLVLRTQEVLYDSLIARATHDEFQCQGQIQSPSSRQSADKRPEDAFPSEDERVQVRSNPCAIQPTDSSVIHVLLDEDSDLFMDIIRFLYVNTFNLETTSGVLDMLKLADKYQLDEIADKCISWVQEHWTADVFYAFFDAGLFSDTPDAKSLKSDVLIEKVSATLCRMLASRRIFLCITEDPRWGTLPAESFSSFMMHKSISLAGEDEVIRLLLRWLSVSKDAAVAWKILDTWKMPKSMLFRPHEWTGLMSLLEASEEPEPLFSNASPRVKVVKLNPSFAVHRDAPSFIGSKSLSIPERGIRLQTGANPVTMHPRDLLLQDSGYVYSDKEIPRLRVKLHSVVWSHKEKRSQRGHSWSAGSSSLPLLMGEQLSEKIPEMPTNWDQMGSKNASANEDYEASDSQHTSINRSRQLTTGTPQVPEHMRVEHQIICGVVNGSGLRSIARMRHAIRISQEDRTSLYKLTKGKQAIYFGGTPTSIEFELSLEISDRNTHDICECSLKLFGMAIEDGPPVVEENFSASAQERLHFFVCSAYFDGNSSYQVELKWVDDLMQSPFRKDDSWDELMSPRSLADSDRHRSRGRHDTFAIGVRKEVTW